MNAYRIATRTDGTAFYTLRTTLDGLDYQLEFSWSTREERWYLTIKDSQGDLLMGATKLVCNVPLLRYRRHIEGTPAGELAVTTTSTDYTPPGFYELGAEGRCQLVYFEGGAA
jgi:hypothetical protein